MSHRTRCALVLAVLAAACQGEQIAQPALPAAHPEVEGLALRVQVDVEHGTVQVLPADGSTARGADGLSYAILGDHEVGITTTNLVRTPIPNNKALVTFDVAVSNRLTSATLVAPTFPPSLAGSGGLLLFPFAATQVVGGAPTTIAPNAAWNGDGTPGSGAPRNFFNDAPCTAGASSDCFRWEQFAAPLGPGETTAPQQVGYIVPQAVRSFQALLVLAADISSDLPAVAAIAVTPPSDVMDDGLPAYFSAVAYDARGQVLPWPTITWTSADATALEFENGSALVGSRTGPSVVVHGRKVGPTSFTVSSGGVQVLVPVDIQVNTIVLVQLMVPDSSIVVGDQLQGDARVKDNSGNIVPGFLPTWSTSDPNVLQVDQTGLITAVGPGSATITATAGLASGTVKIDVSAPAVGFLLGALVTTPPGIVAAIGTPNVSLEVYQHGALIGQLSTAVVGSFRMSSVPAGQITIVVTNPPTGCTSPGATVTISPTDTEFTLVQMPCATTLVVHARDGGAQPIPGMVTGFATSNNIFTRFVADANGDFTFSGFPPLPFSFTPEGVPPGCFIPPPLVATPTPGSGTAVDWVVTCPGPSTVTGHTVTTSVVQRDGSAVPVPGAQVVATADYNSISAQTLAGPDGAFLMYPGPIGEVSVIAFGSPCGVALSPPMTIPGRGAADVTLDLSACAIHTAALQVTDISPVPTQLFVDLRVQSLVSGAEYGGIAFLGSPFLVDMLGDGSAYAISLGSASAGCTLTVPPGLVATPGSTNVQVLVNCQ